jgi:hypothetical protein
MCPSSEKSRHRFFYASQPSQNPCPAHSVNAPPCRARFFMSIVRQERLLWTTLGLTAGVFSGLDVRVRSGWRCDAIDGIITSHALSMCQVFTDQSRDLASTLTPRSIDSPLTSPPINPPTALPLELLR